MEKENTSVLINWIYIAICFVAFCIITLIIFCVPNFDAYDKTILQAIQIAITNYPVILAHYISSYGNHYFLYPLLISTATLFSFKKYRDGILLILFTQIAWHFGDFIKDIIQRERPNSLQHSGYSFPSGHSSVSMTFWGILIYTTLTYVKNKFWRYFLISFFTLMIFLAGISRFKLNAHYPTDVTGGFLFGLILVNLHIIIIKIFKK